VDTLVSKVRRNLQAHGLIVKGDSVLVAVSGGVDSMVLLDVLRLLAAADGFMMSVAHFNHQLRGRASELDEKLVQKYCLKHGLRFETGRGDVKKLTKAKKISMEMAARELRLKFLAETAERLACDRVALAHHAGDQAELFFIRLFRGSGGDGLAGMDWSGVFSGRKNLKSVRPFLDVPKERLLKYANQHKVLYREDATNRDNEIIRNRVRTKLVPKISELFGPAALSSIQRTMEVIGAEAELAGLEAERWMKASKRKAFEKLHLAVQRQVIRQQLWELAVPESFDLIEELRGPADVWIQVNPRTFLSRTQRGVVQQRGPLQGAFCETATNLDLSGRSGEVLFGTLKLTWQLEDAAKRFIKPSRVVGVEVFDAEKVGVVIRLRHWRAGDRFQPLGMPQSVKLQDWFVNRKVPLERRRQLAVAEVADGRIFWVEGERIGEQFKLDKASRQRLKWQWQAESPP
jgi:tRNA(Ile)-lysidine synthase